MTYDILIKAGTVVDGTGQAPRVADVGISGEKISAIGDLGNSEGKITINASGKIVSPGFVDITSHSDTHLTLFKYPNQESLLMQGVATIIGGNCGASLAPLGGPEAINAIRKWANISEINIGWSTLEEYLAEVETIRPAVNYGTFVGYGTLRRGVIGDEVRQLNVEEREQVKYLLRGSMNEGAFGLSLGLAYGHERVSSTEEVIEIGKVLGLGSGGIIKIHLRSEGFEILASVNEAVRIARETGVPVQISHLKAIGKKAWPALKNVLELIARARESGLNINFDVSPWSTTGSSLYLLIPGWAREGGFSELFRRINNPSENKKIISALQSHTLHYDKILITSAKTKNMVGHTIAQIAEETGLSPEEAILDALIANEGRISVVGKTVSVKNTRAEIENPNSFLASDGPGMSQDEQQSGNLAHPRSFGSFPRFLGRLAPLLNIPLPQAIAKITSGPAEKLGLKDRGILAGKNYADITVFDPRIIKDRATYADPFKYPAGVEWVVINGQVAVEQGRITGERAGKVLRKNLA